MKTMLKGLFIGVFALVFVALPAFAAKPDPKVPICHFDAETGTYHMINVSTNAEPAHMAHGDGYPGKEMAENGGFFEDDCTAWALVGSVTVPVDSVDGVTSDASLMSGKNYIFKASGTAYACNEPGCMIEFDADYSTSDTTNWVDGVAAPYDVEGPDLLDLMVNGGFVDWGAYNGGHMYEHGMVGTGGPVSFQVYDVYYPNNTGNLTVDIYAEL